MLWPGMKEAWLSHAMRAVPRYTSYPTAADFSAAVGLPEAKAWSAQVRPGEPVSAYLHIPFCDRLCWYCGCATSVPNTYERVADYLHLLLREIELRSEIMGPHGGIGHLHLGGGSPNVLNADDFLQLVEAISHHFGIREDAEIAVELDPRTIKPGQIGAFAKAGVNRASLGVQTIDHDVQQAINRIQPREMVLALIDELRSSGIRSINMDLMYGLPGQRAEHVAEAAEFAVSMHAARVSVFGYAHLPWFAKHQRAIDETALAGLEERFRQAETAARVLCNAGYVAIGLDHYAHKDDPLALAMHEGRLRRNFQGYTDDPCETLIGIGATSISSFRQGFIQNYKDRKTWGQKVKEGVLPVERGIALTEDDCLRAHAIATLMCTMRVDVAEICREMQVEPGCLDEALLRARRLSEDGLCSVSGSVIEVPEEARVMLRTLAQCFDARSKEAAGQRHAIAV